MQVALIRGEELNRFEMQAYEHLPRLGVDVLAVGSRTPLHQLEGLRLPTALLWQPDRLLPAWIRRRTRRFLGERVEYLAGLRRAVASCDALHAAETFLPMTEQAARLAGETARPLVVTCWENIPFLYEDDLRLAARKRHIREVATRFVAVTPEASLALQAEGVEAQRITVIPAAVDRERFAPSKPTGRFLEEWSVPTEARVLLAVGRIIGEKGWLDVLLAVRELRAKSSQEVVVVFLGRGPQEGALMRVADTLGIRGCVRVASFTAYDQLPDAYASADVVVLASRPTPYWEEQFGMVLIEAMSCGRPVVTTKSGSIPSVVGDGAFLVRPYAPDDLAEKILQLLKEPCAAQELVQRATERVARLYDAPVVAAALANMYGSLPRRAGSMAARY